MFVWRKNLFNKLLVNNKDIVSDICSCSANYIGETIRDSEIRCNEHITGKDKNSDCVKHINDHFDHEFQWFVLSGACLRCKIL